MAAKRMCTLLRPLILLLTLGSEAQCQSQFHQAHALLAELDRLQKGGQRDKDTLDKLNDLVHHVPQKVQGLLNEGILELLNSPGVHSPVLIRAKVSAVLQVVPPGQFQPEVFVFGLPPRQRSSYLVAYNGPYCARCSRAWIGLIGKRGAHYAILSEGDNSFDGKSLHVTPLPRGGDGNDRFLVCGTNWGDAHSRLSVTVYSLADNQLKSDWSREDLPQGTVKVTPTEITLSFLTSLRPPWDEKTEVYSILPQSIQLRQTLERPNP
jgi:hypothetical protein